MRQVLKTPGAQQIATSERRTAVPAGGSAGRLRTDRRSRDFMDAVGRLDVGGPAHVEVSEVIDAITAEFALGDALPDGLLAECFLGAPHDVHVLSLSGNIVRHYAASESLPTLYAAARDLATHPAYLAIEVYPTRYVCLRADGSLVDVPQTTEV